MGNHHLREPEEWNEDGEPDSPALGRAHPLPRPTISIGGRADLTDSPRSITQHVDRYVPLDNEDEPDHRRRSSELYSDHVHLSGGREGFRIYRCRRWDAINPFWRRDGTLLDGPHRQ